MAAVAVVAVVVAAVMAAAVAESMPVVVVVVSVVRDGLKSMESLSTTGMSLFDVNVMSVIGRWLWLRWQYWVQ